MSLTEKRAKLNAHLIFAWTSVEDPGVRQECAHWISSALISQIRSDTVRIYDGHALIHVILRLDLARSTWW